MNLTLEKKNICFKLCIVVVRCQGEHMDRNIIVFEKCIHTDMYICVCVKMDVFSSYERARNFAK